MNRGIFLLHIVLLFMLLSCSEQEEAGIPFGTTKGDETALRFALTTSNPTEFQLRAERAELLVSATDMQSITFPLTVTDLGIEGSVEAVLAGEKRTFTINVYDSEERLQYNGSITLDVAPGAMSTLPITIRKVLGQRRGDSLALVTINNAATTPLWDTTTPIHTWSGVTCEAHDSARVTELIYEGDYNLGHIPAEIGYLTELTKLYLRNGDIKIIPKEMELLSKLTYLDLSRNTLTELSDELCQLTNLQVLILSGNEITTISKNLSSLSALTKLDLSNNKISGTFVPNGALKSVQILVLTNNQISDIESSLFNNSSLQELYLERNSLTTLTSAIGYLQELIILKLAENHLTSLPENIGSCEKLQHLEIQQNQLTALPDSLGLLPALLNLNAKSNLLTSLGANIGTLQKIQSIDLSHNQLPFGELEKINLTSGFAYAPQDSIGNTVTLKNKMAFQIGISVSGSKNTYQWFRNNEVLEGAISDSLYVNQSGSYNCVITNPLFEAAQLVDNQSKAMSLNHRPVSVIIEDTVAPILKNAYLTIDSLSANQIIGDTCFEFSDNITPKNEVVITITSLPAMGFLEFIDQEKIDTGFQFTLGSYDDKGSLKYTNENSNSSDSFSFSLTDKEGNISQNYTMKITYF